MSDATSDVPRPPGLRALTSLDEFDRAVTASWSAPVLLFKHSATCGTSALAKEEIDAWLAAHPHPGALVYIVDVLQNRALARAIAERLRIRHESPQVLLLRDGEVTWHASHFNVSARSLGRATGVRS
jgi:bacillithiol system protein YtxJ